MRTGLEVVLEDGLAKEGVSGRAGLITNHTGITRRLQSGARLLGDTSVFDLVALFAPEHGIWGEAQAGIAVRGGRDRHTGLPVYSLYGEWHRPAPDTLAHLDVLIFDMLDLGVRYATRLSIMKNAQDAAAEAGVVFVVLDRPNPITGERIEGPQADIKFLSLVSCHPIPVRHGMTLGELARLFAAEQGWPEPVIVPMEGWRRDWWFDQTGLPWVLPSPNLPTLESLALYPGTCLIEGTNVSEGRGTTRPFELIGAPWLDPFDLAAALEESDQPGVTFRPAYFTPTFSKHAGAPCGGVQVHILDRDAMRPVELGVHLLHALHALSGNRLEWREGREGKYCIDLLSGSDRLRRSLEDGASVAEITAGWTGDAAAFAARRQPYLLYEGIHA